MTLDPNSPLQNSTEYTVTIKGGAGGVRDAAGNTLGADDTWPFTTAAPPPPPPDEGPGGPVLVISSATNPFSRYYAEILRAEGLNEFTATDLSNVTPSVLDAHDVAILGDEPLTAAQAQMLSDWVQAGGDLIAMHPDPQLAGLLGLTDTPNTLANGYIKVDTSSGPGAGIVGQTIQFHGTRRPLHGERRHPDDRHALLGREHRHLRPRGDAAKRRLERRPRRRVHLRPRASRWSRRARAIRPGPARSATAPRRSAPTTCSSGNAAGDSQPDWVNLDKVAIPQADEQQHLLANLIGQMSADRGPLPRFWFLPRDEKAAVVMTGDDHGNGGTAGRFDQYEADSPTGCSVADWQCVRGTSYIYPNTPLSDSQAAAYQAAGLRDRRARRPPTAPIGRPSAARFLLLRPALPIRLELPQSLPARDQPHPLHRLERLGDPAEGRARSTGSASTPTTTTGRAAGSRTARGCSPARGCRCASPTPTAR